jgi:hypothetical protein
MRFRAYEVQLSRLRERLEQAPLEGGDPRAAVEITLALPDGRIERFGAVESPILGPEMRRAHPDIRTYAAVGLRDALLSARLDLTALGVRGIVLTPEGAALIDPVHRGRTDQVMSYWARDDVGGSFECVAIDVPWITPAPMRLRVHAAGDQLKTFRFILMGTGDYTQALGGTSQAIAEMVTSVNRINAILERDAAVRLEAVALMPFEDPATDPYPSNDAVPLLDANIAVVDSIFGSARYDLSQVVTHYTASNYSGISYCPAVCEDCCKGGCVAAGPDVTANWYMLKVMAHEIAHMLGATHTQDANCNRWPETAYEPGSGSTILSYAGSRPCQPYWVQPWADPYFHAASIEQIVNTWTSLPGCGTLTPTGNTPPRANAGADYAIPRSTPFVLVGGGFDPDPWDTLTYCWEQFDKAPTSADPVIGPLFRTRLPSLSGVRALPAAATVLSGSVDPFEKLPAVDRTMHFRLTVRDNHLGTGGHAWDELTVTVSGPPFAVTFPNGGESISSGQAFTVTWSVGGGSVAPTVDILLSTDGGQSWTLLQPNTPNDGSETVRYYTGVTSTACRVKIKAVGNVFYDVSDADFTMIGNATDVAFDPRLPPQYALRLLGRNPTTGHAILGLDVPREAILDVAAYSIQGQRLRTLASGNRAAGRYRLTWEGDDDSGQPLRPGVYFIRLTAGRHRSGTRVVLLR